MFSMYSKGQFVKLVNLHDHVNTVTAPCQFSLQILEVFKVLYVARERKVRTTSSTSQVRALLQCLLHLFWRLCAKRASKYCTWWIQLMSTWTAEKPGKLVSRRVGPSIRFTKTQKIKPWFLIFQFMDWC